jgi:hypothetical protein
MFQPGNPGRQLREAMTSMNKIAGFIYRTALLSAFLALVAGGSAWAQGAAPPPAPSPATPAPPIPTMAPTPEPPAKAAEQAPEPSKHMDKMRGGGSPLGGEIDAKVTRDKGGAQPIRQKEE